MGRKRRSDKHLPQRVYIRSGTYWYVSPSGKWHKLGRTQPEAYAALSQLLHPQSGRLAEHMARYRREVLPTKAIATQKAQQAHMDVLERVFGKMLPHQVQPHHIAEFLDSAPAKTLANRHIALFGHLYTKLIRWGVVDKNPCQGVEKNKEKPRTRYVTDAEFWGVWKIAAPHIQNLMELALITGQRQGDLLRLQWSQVRGDSIEFKQWKTGKLLVVQSAALPSVIRRCKRGRLGRFVVRSKGQPLTSSGVHSAWRRLMVKYGGEPYTFHDLRAKSASDHATGKHLGHESAVVLRKFYRRKPERVTGLDIGRG